VVEANFREFILRENNIKINYPSNWIRNYDNSNPMVKAIFQSPKERPTDQRRGTVFVGIDDTIGNVTLDTFNENVIKSYSQGRSDFKLIESSPSTLSGITAHQIIFSTSQIKVLNVSTIKDKVAYWVMYAAEPDKYLKFLSSAEQMISSFEIL
jgi:serine/threonine-protein kinase